MEDIEFDDNDILDELELGDLKYNTTFLKVLCVLTFVGSGGTLIYLGLFFLNQENMIAFFKNPTGFGESSILFLWVIPCNLCIVGAILMILRNRLGFVIYLLGGALPFFYTLYYALANDVDLLTSITTTIMRYVFTIGFIIMYATQLHVMKPLFKQPAKQ